MRKSIRRLFVAGCIASGLALAAGNAGAATRRLPFSSTGSWRSNALRRRRRGRLLQGTPGST
jgi:hypothetical protein